MAIVTAVCSVSKQDMLDAYISGNTFNMALYDDTTATLGAATTVYTATGEISGTGYSAGGQALTGVTAALDGTIGYLDFDNISWTGATFSTDGFLMYVSTLANAAFLVERFPSTFSPVAGTFEVRFPTPAGASAVFAVT